MSDKINSQISFYYHIPFCSFACHYCDFVKTSDFDNKLTQKYFNALFMQTKTWLQTSFFSAKIPSIFFGGGTPGLFAQEYQQILELLNSYKDNNCEVCLEVNPNNIDEDKLKKWSELGFNRLSIGVQTFNEKGLKTLTRDHNGTQAIEAIKLAKEYFKNISVDLIYGWPEQKTSDFKNDLTIIDELAPNHLSLYNLSYEPRTPFSLKKDRGVFSSVDEQTEQELYNLACSNLASNGYEHYEISNWAKPGFESVHNQRYWRMLPYIGIGAGAHGFIPHTHIGKRYSYTNNIHKFSQLNSELAINEDVRTQSSWFIEYLYTGLRTKEGVDTGVFQPFLKVNSLDQIFPTSYYLSNSSYRSLKESEWFRHNAHVETIINKLNL